MQNNSINQVFPAEYFATVPEKAVTAQPLFKLVSSVVKPQPSLESITNHMNDLVEQSKPIVANHQDIIDLLLIQITKIEFGEIIGFKGEASELKQKHIIYAITKNLLNVAKSKNWNMAIRNGSVFVFNGAYWKKLDREQIKHFLGESAIRMSYPEYEARHFEFKDKLIRQFLSDGFFKQPESNQDEVLINFQNGTGRIINGEFTLTGFDAKDFITYQLPYEYDSTALCPMFDKYLLRVLPDEQSRIVLQEFCGFIFTKLNLEKCLMLLGGGSNGKSVLFNILNALIGKENTLNCPMSNFEKEGYLAKLADILLNYSSEKGTDLNPEIFKALISGEPIQARELYQNPFTLMNRAKFIFNSNTLPKETESSHAYFRRFLIIPFEQTITESEINVDLADNIIKDELPAVFLWLLVGLERLMKNRKFSECQKSKQAIVDFKKSSDSVLLFIEEESYVKSVVQSMGLKELFSEYKGYCINSNFRPVSIQKFSERLRNAGFEIERKEFGNVIFLEKKSFDAF